MGCTCSRGGNAATCECRDQGAARARRQAAEERRYQASHQAAIDRAADARRRADADRRFGITTVGFDLRPRKAVR